MGRGAAIFSISIAMALASKIPTQIGITVSDAISLSTMMGMLLAGSIIRPRILTSTSMSPPFFLDSLAHETVWECRGNPHAAVTTRRRSDGLRSGKIHRLVLAAAAHDLAPRRVLALNHYFHNFS